LTSNLTASLVLAANNKVTVTNAGDLGLSLFFESHQWRHHRPPDQQRRRHQLPSRRHSPTAELRRRFLSRNNTPGVFRLDSPSLDFLTCVACRIYAMFRPMSKQRQPAPALNSVWPVKKKIFGGARPQCRWCIVVAFGYPDVDVCATPRFGRKPGHIYGRNTNPTVAAFENKVRLMESAEAATVFPRHGRHQQQPLHFAVTRRPRRFGSKGHYGGTNNYFWNFCHAFRSK